MKPKVIKTEAEYKAALAYLETLMDAEAGSPEEEELELFSVLVEQYEAEHYPIDPPDPVDAILFRMEQEGLTRKDLAAYLGSSSKVSEVLNRKRPLSLTMIRNLHEGLGIPADVLLQEPGKTIEPLRYDMRAYPFTAMLKADYFEGWQGTPSEAKVYAEELLRNLFAHFQGELPQAIYCRRTDATIDAHALVAWQARVLALTQTQTLRPYKPGALDDAFVKKLVRASYFSEGPRLVRNLLLERGIHFVRLPHLPRTYLDGAAFLSPTGRPVIGMTLRHDRLDNFWFTLLHEVAHIRLHLHDSSLAFFDDTEHVTCAGDDPRESEANAFACDALIPDAVWRQEAPRLLESRSDQAVLALAEQLEISPAIVAGRVRWESGDYRRYSRLIGKGEVRKLFAEPQQEMVASA